jgi:2-polyprenyl-3-methyl-5-hydroxy-6-metoxy-1,4-benzoquinol methylase
VRSFNRLLNSFENFRTSGRILDIGCGQGDFLFSAKSHGWYAYGSEYSDAAIKICLERGLEVVKEPVSPLSFGSEKFDVITSFEVI